MKQHGGYRVWWRSGASWWKKRRRRLNRLTGYLKVYFPQILEWFAKLDTKLVCDFLERWPSLEELQTVSPGEVKEFFRHRRAAWRADRVADGLACDIPVDSK